VFTKSNLQSLIQCPRKLWLEWHKPELLPSESSGLSRRAMDGVIVGEKAREQLGNDFFWPRSSGETKEDLAQEAKIKLVALRKPAVEVPLVHTDLYARADALVPHGDAYILRETKASTFRLKKDNATPDAPKETHLDDVAIQAWVMEGAGLPIAAVELNLLDAKWRYQGDGDYSGLFRQLDVTKDIALRKTKVSNWLEQARGVVATAMPPATIGKQCGDPSIVPSGAIAKHWIRVLRAPLNSYQVRPEKRLRES
jgi:hypothetical protein